MIYSSNRKGLGELRLFGFSSGCSPGLLLLFIISGFFARISEFKYFYVLLMSHLGQNGTQEHWEKGGGILREG